MAKVNPVVNTSDLDNFTKEALASQASSGSSIANAFGAFSNRAKAASQDLAVKQAYLDMMKQFGGNAPVNSIPVQSDPLVASSLSNTIAQFNNPNKPEQPVQTPQQTNNINPNLQSNDFITYANQGAIRNQALSPELINSLSVLKNFGLRAEVFSGGQDAEGPNRTGSHRHDHGNAADVYLYNGDRRLDWNNQNDLNIFKQVVPALRQAGITGIGAGDGYMRPGSMHVGFGAEGVWGANGKRVNAAPWLVNAFYGIKPNSSGNKTIEALNMLNRKQAELKGTL